MSITESIMVQPTSGPEIIAFYPSQGMPICSERGCSPFMQTWDDFAFYREEDKPTLIQPTQPEEGKVL